MPKLNGVLHLCAVRALEKAGFQIVRQSGKHIVLSNGGFFLTDPPSRSGQPLTMAGIVQDAGLTIEEFKKLV